MMFRIFRPVSRKIFKDNTRSCVCRYLSVQQAKDTGLSWEEVRIPVPWGHVAGKWWGSKDQRPILCLHGWLDNANTFDNLIPLLPPENSYLAIDFPGEGLSSHIPQGFMYKYVESAATVRRVQNHFKWPTVSLVGHSYGAQCSFLFAALFPKDVDFVVALDALKPMSFNPTKNFKKESGNTQKFFQYESFKAEDSPLYSKKDLIKRLSDATRNSVTPKSCEVLIERGAENVNGLYKLLRDIRVKINTEFAFSQKELLQLTKSVTCDMLYIKAKDFDYFEKKEYIFEAAEILKKSARSFEYHELPGTHHFHLNNAEDIAPVVNTFLRRVQRESPNS